MSVLFSPIMPRDAELCSLFRPELYWWRMVLILRKFCFVGVALMFSSTPLFQAWYAHQKVDKGASTVLLEAYFHDCASRRTTQTMEFLYV